MSLGLVRDIIRQSLYFTGAMGYITRIDSNGNAEGNYTLLARKKGPGVTLKGPGVTLKGLGVNRLP